MIKGLFVANSTHTPFIELRWWGGNIFFISLQMCFLKKKKKSIEADFLIKIDADPSCPWCCYLFCCCCGCCYLIWAFIFLFISPWQWEIVVLIFLLDLGEQQGGGPIGGKCFCFGSNLFAPQVRVRHSFLRLSPPPALAMDTKAKPCCLLLSVLFTDANPCCSSSRVSRGIKCALWKCLHLKVLWRSGAKLLNGAGFYFHFFLSPPLPRIKHQFRTLITNSRKPVPKAFILPPSPADLNLVSFLSPSHPPMWAPITHEIKGFPTRISNEWLSKMNAFASSTVHLELVWYFMEEAGPGAWSICNTLAHFYQGSWSSALPT